MIHSRMTPARRKTIIAKVVASYEAGMRVISRHAGGINTGGAIRGAMGKLGEGLAGLMWMEVAEVYRHLAPPLMPTKGEQDEKKCIDKKGNFYFAHVDKHCYIKDKFVLAIESKSYLDACYYLRASSDFRLLKQYHDPELTCVVVSIENALADASKKFIEGEGWIDGAFILADGKRSSSKPIWNPKYKKPLNLDKVGQLVDFLDELFCKNL